MIRKLNEGEAKPCLNCQAPSVLLMLITRGGASLEKPPYHSVSCTIPGCGMCGPFGNSEEEAIAAWDALHGSGNGQREAVRSPFHRVVDEIPPRDGERSRFSDLVYVLGEDGTIGKAIWDYTHNGFDINMPVVAWGYRSEVNVWLAAVAAGATVPEKGETK